jgi:hypothetical protein
MSEMTYNIGMFAAMMYMAVFLLIATSEFCKWWDRRRSTLKYENAGNSNAAEETILIKFTRNGWSSPKGEQE